MLEVMGIAVVCCMALTVTGCFVFLAAARAALRSGAPFRIEFRFGRAAYTVAQTRRTRSAEPVRPFGAPVDDEAN